MNHSVECRQRNEKIQYDLLQEKLKQAPIIPEESGEQTVVTPAPAASETDTSMMEPSAAPSASERIRQKRGGLHRPEHADASEPVQTSTCISASFQKNLKLSKGFQKNFSINL